VEIARSYERENCGARHNHRAESLKLKLIGIQTIGYRSGRPFIHSAAQLLT
jgi:hypothetical protein